ncbi:DUF2493 domain-containing protein, partial [Thiolapillus sp.]
PRSEAYFVFPLAQGTPGKQCGLAATGDYQPSLRSPWLAALVVAGSRDYDRKDTLFERLDHLTQNLPRQELLLIKGGASGADALGSEWAEDRSIARASFPAFWKDLDSPRAIVKTGRYGAYNARAGMDRNARMAACATLLAAFPSRPDISSGTKDMIAQATALGLAYRVVMPTTSESFATDNTYGEHFEIQKHCP